MTDTNNHVWSRVLNQPNLSVSLMPDQSSQADAKDVFDPPESFLLLPAVQTAPEDPATDAFDFKTSHSGDETAFDVADVLVSSYQTGGSGSDDRDVLPEPEPVPEFGMTDHFDFF
ncbi:hypothetical protein FIU85_01370 [Roseovarius sp. THAF8]|uniref:hypothetical protein n=1 Tax=Roseovarius sp. THAF8 TaxID=2587846 RepID=UPI0012684F03|nr:hypothetical protein [Roseovarius sp. THAF8]QFT95942.1 hypothetical protein FIU85_01370 [Roseovarius sp. THAF8]